MIFPKWWGSDLWVFIVYMMAMLKLFDEILQVLLVFKKKNPKCDSLAQYSGWKKNKFLLKKNIAHE